MDQHHLLICLIDILIVFWVAQGLALRFFYAYCRCTSGLRCNDNILVLGVLIVKW